VNPGRSTGVALFVGDWATAQLWLFWLAPIVGACLGAAVYRFIGGKKDRPAPNDRGARVEQRRARLDVTRARV